jgi:fanconi anemia core complex subunit
MLLDLVPGSCLQPADWLFMCLSSGGTKLLALSAKGRLMTCSLDLNSEMPGPARMTAANAGQKIKELLSGIGDVSER